MLARGTRMRKPGVGVAAMVALAALGAATALGAQAAGAAAAQHGGRGIAGEWSGSVASVPLVLHIVKAGAGWSATLDSPTQHAFGLQTANLQWRPPHLSFALPVAQASYAGVMNASGEIQGAWTQGGASLTLTLRRGTARPVKMAAFSMPSGVRQIQVAIPAGQGEGTLAGTLSEPAADPPAHGWPGAVILAGSGPTDRNGNNPLEPIQSNTYAKLAAYLSAHGVAVLRYDKRGLGGSASAPLPRHMRRFATDARWAARWLMRQPGVNPRRVTLIGHSLGSALALMAAAQPAPRLPAPLAGIVSLEGAGRTMAAVLDWQQQEQERRAASNPAMVVKVKQGFAALRTRMERTSLLRSFLALDPPAAARRDRLPTLVIQGGKDIQVTAALDARPLAGAIPVSTPHELKVFPDMTHMLEDYSGAPGPAEYRSPADTPLDPGMLRATLAWVKQPGAS